MTDGCFRKRPDSLFKLPNQGTGQQTWSFPSFPQHSNLVKNNSREELRLHHSSQFLQSPFLSKEALKMTRTLSSRLQSATVIQHDLHPFSSISLASYILLCILRYSWWYRISGLPEACHSKSHFQAPPQNWTALYLDHKPTGNRNGIIHLSCKQGKIEMFLSSAVFHYSYISLPSCLFNYILTE